ncbi:MAG TPA: hypothetical protein VMC48_01445 [Methanobacterium sp.]|nr:hypothetical protein [Methanobacterium sp.]
MDEFFQKLREIQKKERNLSGLAPVGENFYQNISKYFNILMKKIDDNPFSFESYLLRDAQRITAEICERREHKISNSAVMSVQRSYQLFKESELDTSNNPKIPRNSTPEEEKLFNALVNSLINYREKMSGPLKFQNTQSRDRSEDLSLKDARPDEAKGGTAPEAAEEDFENKVEGSDFQDGFSAEEEAAIEDDIYKQFGKEPFPGSKLDEKMRTSGESDQGKKLSGGNLKSTGKANIEKTLSKNSNKATYNDSNELKDQSIPTDLLMVLEELPSIMGIDKKVYGPFSPQDIVTIPESTARILVKNHKGKFIQNYK